MQSFVFNVVYQACEVAGGDGLKVLTTATTANHLGKQNTFTIVDGMSKAVFY